MTARTIRLVDTYCDAANWQDCIDSNIESLKEIGGYPAWGQELTDEIRRWGMKRDKLKLRLQRIVDALTDYEKDWIRRKCGDKELAIGFLKLGIEPNWV